MKVETCQSGGDEPHQNKLGGALALTAPTAPTPMSEIKWGKRMLTTH